MVIHCFIITRIFEHHSSLLCHKLAQGATITMMVAQHMPKEFAAMREEVLHAIFLYLHKSYDALDRSRGLEILEGYSMGTRDLCLFRRYWERLRVVARVGGYYREPFFGERGMTQGYPMFPTIFNVVVDSVVHHWESLAVEGSGADGRDDSSSDEAGHPERRTIGVHDDRRRRKEEGHTRMKVQAEFFYIDNGMVASTNPGWLNTAFDMLTGLFDRLELNRLSTKQWVLYAIHSGRSG